MGLVDQKPADLPSTNELDSIPDDLLGGPPPPAEIRLGANVLMIMDTPPAIGDTIDISMRVRIKAKGEEQNSPDGPITHLRRGTIVVAWPLGTTMPEPKKTQAELDAEAEAEAAKDQPPLFDETGEAIEPDDDDGPEEFEADDNVVEFGGRPAFSDGDE